MFTNIFFDAAQISLKMTITEILLDYVFSLHVSESFLFIQSSFENVSFSCVLLNPLVAIYSRKPFVSSL